MLIVTHEMGFAAHVADRIAFIDEGRIVDVGPPREVFHESASRACGSSCRPITTATASEAKDFARDGFAGNVALQSRGSIEC